MSGNREALKAAIAEVKRLRVIVKEERIVLKALRVKQLQAKRDAAVERAKARLEKLLSKQVGAVGTKAKRAAKRPSKAVVLTGEAARAAAA